VRHDKDGDVGANNLFFYWICKRHYYL